MVLHGEDMKVAQLAIMRGFIELLGTLGYTTDPETE